MTKRVGNMSASQRDRHNQRARRRYARRALRAGKEYIPRKHTPKMPSGVNMSLLEDEARFAGETPIERQRRRWRERYAKQAMETNGRYTPRVSGDTLSPKEYRRRLARLKQMINETT